MFQSIDRVYDASRARDRLGFMCRTILPACWQAGVKAETGGEG